MPKNSLFFFYSWVALFSIIMDYQKVSSVRMTRCDFAQRSLITWTALVCCWANLRCNSSGTKFLDMTFSVCYNPVVSEETQPRGPFQSWTAVESTQSPLCSEPTKPLIQYYNHWDGQGIWGRMDACMCVAESLAIPLKASQHCYIFTWLNPNTK